MANYIGISAHENDRELPPAYLDYNAMVNHLFLERNEQILQYRLIFDRCRAIHVTLPTPVLFDYQAKRRYVITREEATEYERRTEAARRSTATQEAIAVASQYDPSYNFRYRSGYPWP